MIVMSDGSEAEPGGLKSPKAEVPPGCLVYAIGDVHGCSALLDDLLAQIEADAERFEADRRVLVFVGDYIDRGPDSAGVIERLVSRMPAGFEVICLKGNHDQMLLDFLERPEIFDHWMLNGAETTLSSYGLKTYEFDWYRGDEAACRDGLLAAMPERHRAFFDNLRLSVIVGDYFFCHAGVRPGVPLDEQVPQDLMWIREDFLNSPLRFGKVVVHGHTPVDEPEVRFNRIGIDTKACLSGRLTALRLYGESRDFLSTGRR
jgi:serine/threonine protein phosphatase 1